MLTANTNFTLVTLITSLYTISYMIAPNLKLTLAVCVIIIIIIAVPSFYNLNKSQSSEVTSTDTINLTNTIDTARIPLGDGKLSTSPKKGYVYSCENNFSANAGGASKDGDWINGETWNLKEKISVRGDNSWGAAWFESTITGLIRSLTGNGLPVGSKTGTFPVASDDPAYDIDRNPNTIKEQVVNIKLTNDPQIASNPSCVPMGAIGRAINGVAIYNALDGRGEDAVAHEVQDSCNGHPERNGEYHYHGPSNCIAGLEQANT